LSQNSTCAKNSGVDQRRCAGSDCRHPQSQRAGADHDSNRRQNRWHLQIAERWVAQYNFYVNDRRWGRMVVRMCSYLPFSARVRLNQHHWLANRMREEDIDFEQCSNAFLRCSAPERLQDVADTGRSRSAIKCQMIRLTDE
jgi:hypothetical protein